MVETGRDNKGRFIAGYHNGTRNKPKVLKSCQFCGNEFRISQNRVDSGRGRFCSKKCISLWLGQKLIGENSPNWKSGKFISQKGDVMILRPDRFSNPSKSGWRRYIPEHRLIMENHLGRKLLKSELIHHLNGNKQDNRVDNLFLTTRTDHKTFHKGEFVCPYCNKLFRVTSQLKA